MLSDLLPQFLHRHRLSLKPGLPSLIRGSAAQGRHEGLRWNK